MKRILFSIVCILLIPAIFAHAGTADKNTQLIQAAGKGNLHDVRVALSAGADINAKNIEGATTLMLASRYGHTAMVELLLDKGADVNAKDANGATALIMASLSGYSKVVILLLN